MPRPVFYQYIPDPNQLTIDEFVKPREDNPKPKRVLRGIGDKVYSKAVRELAQMLKLKDYVGFKGVHAVILFERMYRTTYDLPVIDFESSRHRRHAAIAADRMLNDLFGGRVAVYIQYHEYAWRREAAREALRREQRKTGTKMSWRRYFSKKYDFDDWRSDYVRVHGKAPNIVIDQDSSPVDLLDELMQA